MRKAAVSLVLAPTARWAGVTADSRCRCPEPDSALPDERVYYPVHARPYTPAHHFPQGKKDSGFQSKLQIAVALAAQAKAAGLVFRAVAADCAYGDHDSFRADLHAAGLAFVMALKPRHGTWSYGTDAYTPVDAAHALTCTDADHAGDWTRIERTFRDGHTATWWAAEARLGW